MKATNIEYRAMADGTHKVVQATIIEEDGTARRATLGEILSIEGFRTAAARVLRDNGIGVGGLLNKPELLSDFEKNWVVVLYQARGGRLLSIPQCCN